ncbi:MULTISPECIES: hypothetical protein [Bacillaceae]|uniref:Uncharacterized protein n=1 Tax=Evansella alkalicola TaxID=745819 RepID=A0ABS6JN27_9BACI|nr:MULTISPECIES: hypothetical protein [Bacillaceae]MBU9719968.1 hypothetical protein [Bacillus alkalicola]
MIFEFSNDLVPILVSISLYLTVFAAHLMNSLAKEYVVQHRYRSNQDIQTALFEAMSEDQSTEGMEQRQSFITRIVKRKEAPEDDGEYQLSPTQLIMKTFEEDNNGKGKSFCIHNL